MRKIMKKRYFLAFLFTAICLTASASCGATDYSGSSGKLYDMVVYVVAMYNPQNEMFSHFGTKR